MVRVEVVKENREQVGSCSSAYSVYRPLMRHILPYIHIWIVSLFYYIAGLLSSWFVVLFVRDIWSIVLKIYLVWWYDILPVIKASRKKGDTMAGKPGGESR